MDKKGGNGFVSFLLIIIILIMLGFGAIFSGLVKVNGPLIYIGNDPKLNTKVSDAEESSTKAEDKLDTKVAASEDVTTGAETAAEAQPAEEMIPKSSAIEIKPQQCTIPTTQILSHYEKKLTDFSNSLYSIADINNDKIPELFIYTTGTIKNQIIAYTDIYTYDETTGESSNNYIVYAGQVQGRVDNNTVLYKMNDGKLLSVYGHMGNEVSTSYTLANAWLIRTDSSSREVKKDEEYTKGDVAIEFKKATDKSLIKNYKD